MQRPLYSVIVILWATHASAQMEKCRSISNNEDRLRCYDDALDKPIDVADDSAGSNDPKQFVDVRGLSVTMSGRIVSPSTLTFVADLPYPNPILILTKFVPDEQLKAVIERCAKGECSVRIDGKLGKIENRLGLIASSLSAPGPSAP